MNSVPLLAIYGVLMLIAGLGIPVMASLNGGLGDKLHSPTLAIAIVFLVAFLSSLCCLLLTDGIPKLSLISRVPLYFYCGGVIVVFYMLSMVWVAPSLGVGNAITLVLLGQLVSMSIIDHYGFLGALHEPMSKQRLVGLVLMVMGVLLTVRR